jgi:ABC-type glycerol-3-phosphate transport system substrate-binding protein
MKRKVLLVTGFVLLSISLLFAGPGQQSGEQGGSTEITWIFPGTSDPERAYANGIAADFNKAYPQYHLTVQFDSWNTILPKVIAMCQAGTPPDLFWGPQAYMSDMHAMGFLQPIDSGLAGYDLSHFYPLTMQMLKINGELYSLPTMIEIATAGGFVRPKIIEKFYGDWTKIQTFDDYLKANAACNGVDFNGTGRKDTYGNQMPGIGYEQMYLLELVANNNGLKLLDFLDPGKKRQWVEVLSFIRELGKYNVPGYENQDYKDGQRLLSNNSIATNPATGSWMYGNIYEMVSSPSSLSGEELNIMVGPVGPSQRGPAVAGANVYGPLMFKGISEARKKAAIEFIKFHATKANAARFPAIMHVPARDDVSIDDVLAITPYPDKQTYRAYIENFSKILASGNVVPRQPILAMNEVGDATRVACIDMWKGNKTAEQAYNTLFPVLTNLWKK